MSENTYDFKLLQYFLVLMDERSVTHAATRLNLTQPAVSHALSRLRVLFGDPLLVKGRERMTATSRALEVEVQVRRLLADAEALLHTRTVFDPATSAARFSVMTAEFLEHLLAPPLSRLLSSEAPGIRVEFHAADREHAHAWFEEGRIDYRVGWWPSPPQTLRFKMLFRERLVCIARKDHPFIANPTLEKYLNAQHVRTPSERTGISERAVDRAAAVLHCRVAVAMRVQGLLPLLNAVAHSDMIATVPKRMAESLADAFGLGIAALPLTDVPDGQVALYWHERTHNDAAHRWFRERLVELLKSF